MKGNYVATEEGLVITAGPTIARVKTKKSEACKACASRKSCSVMGGGNDMEVDALNLAGARAGDRVVVKFQTASLLKATFLLYIFPILCLFAGAVSGQAIGEKTGLNPSACSAAVGFLFFAGSILFVRKKGNALALKKDYQPAIVRIKKRPLPSETATDNPQV